MGVGKKARYSGLAMLLHWLLAIGVITQWRIAEAAEHAPTEDAGSAIMSNHFSLGITLLVLAALRLLVRRFQPNPPVAAHIVPWERLLAKTVHTAFYVLLIAMPLAGWTAMSKFGYGVDVFGVISLPPLPVGIDKELGGMIFDLHALAGITLLVLVAVHLLAVLKHTLIDKDGNLFRMLPFGTPKG